MRVCLNIKQIISQRETILIFLQYNNVSTVIEYLLHTFITRK